MTNESLLSSTRQFWDANPCGLHADYEAQRRQRYEMEPWLPAEIERIAKSHDSILEVGCGQGVDSILICSTMAPGGRYLGIDYSPASVASAQSNAHTLQDHLAVEPEYRVGNAEAIDLADESFSAVYSMGVLHHTANEQRAIAEVRRVLMTGGTAYILLYRKPAPKVAIAQMLRAVQRGIDMVLGTDRAIYRLIRRWGSSSRTFGTMFLECFGVPYMKWYNRKEVEALFSEFKSVEAVAAGANLGVFGSRSGRTPFGYFWVITARK